MLSLQLEKAGAWRNRLLSTENTTRANGPFAINFFAIREEVEEWRFELCFLCRQAQLVNVRI